MRRELRHVARLGPKVSCYETEVVAKVTVENETLNPPRRVGHPSSPAPSQIPDPAGPDEPAHAWRGLMLDSARTRWDVDLVHELLELMARYRLNRVHWHLTDDSGWRFPVPGYERLVEVGAQLPRPDYSWYDNVLPSRRDQADDRAREVDYNGAYSAEEITGVVEHARRLGIEVMPEVDLRAHMAAASRPVAAAPATWHPPNDLLCPGAGSYRFATAALEAITHLFPFSRVHIGGDECKYWIWESDPELIARVVGHEAAPVTGVDEAPADDPQRRRLSGPDSGNSGLGPRLQGVFTDHAREVLRRRKRRLAAWDELRGSPTPGGELILAGRADVGVTTAERSGHDWVYADCTRLYLNRVAADPEV